MLQKNYQVSLCEKNMKDVRVSMSVKLEWMFDSPNTESIYGKKPYKTVHFLFKMKVFLTVQFSSFFVSDSCF